MNNIKDKVYKALTDEGLEVTDIYPKAWAKLPAVQYVEEDNSVAEWTDDKVVLRQEKVPVKLKFLY